MAGEDDAEGVGFNIPYLNTAFILLGPGCSITVEAIRLLAREGVCIGVSAGYGTPLHAAVDIHDPSLTMLSSQSEYRNPQPLHKWLQIWSDDVKRMGAAKRFQQIRYRNLKDGWDHINASRMPISFKRPKDEIEDAVANIHRATGVEQIAGFEGALTKKLYQAAARAAAYPGEFSRVRGAGGKQDVNGLLDQANYIAYGLASVVLWTLGIPASLSVMHGKTRAGGLVFDVADLVKDAICLPCAFAAAAAYEKPEGWKNMDGQPMIGDGPSGFKKFLWGHLRDFKAVERMFSALDEVSR
jgi:CRISPR-associated protein Cas1